MRIADDILDMLNENQVNYTVKAILHFNDGTNNGNIKVKASDSKEAEKLARTKLENTWNAKGGLKKIEIISIKKG